MANRDEKLLGIATDVTLDHVLALPLWQEPLDVLLCTGDLSQDDSDSSYQRLKEKLHHIDAIQCFLPGNHDDMDALSRVLAGERTGDQCFVLGNWCIVALNSQWPGHVPGQLTQEQLIWLERQLEKHKKHYVLIALHHHIYPIGTAWLDAIALQQPQTLQSLISQHPHVKAVLSGHVHHASEQQHGATQWLTAPSSCFQTDTSQGDTFAVSQEQPGVRELLLHNHGEITTTVHRCTDAPLDFDPTITDY